MTPEAGLPRYEPDRAGRKLIGPLFGLACLAATLSGVFVLALLLGAVVSKFIEGRRGSDLQLIGPLADDAALEAALPQAGVDLIVVASVDKVLHFRVFDATESQVPDSDETQLEGKAGEIAELKQRLEGLWPPHELSRSEKDQLLEEIAPLLGHPEMRHRSASELIGDLTRLMQDSDPRLAGFRVGIAGSLWLLAMVALFSIPIGVGAAVFLEEYTPPGFFRKTIQVNISNLAGVPSIVYGLLGLALFVDALGYKSLAMGQSLWAGALTLGLLILPVIVIATQEALRTVPTSLRQAAMALGATRWQVIRDHVVPSAVPGILTGVILALSRAIGETAPLLMVGAAALILEVPKGPSSQFTALPVEIYNYAKEANRDYFYPVAAGGILILVVLLLTMNATAIVIRNRYARNSRG